MHAIAAWQYYNASPQRYSDIQVFDVLVDQRNAARGDELADSRRLIRTVDAVERVTKVKRFGTLGAWHHPSLSGPAQLMCRG